ncbi:hypothetical protein D3C72_1671100 [compost metagenome]
MQQLQLRNDLDLLRWQQLVLRRSLQQELDLRTLGSPENRFEHQLRVQHLGLLQHQVRQSCEPVDLHQLVHQQTPQMTELDNSEYSCSLPVQD